MFKGSRKSDREAPEDPEAVASAVPRLMVSQGDREDSAAVFRREHGFDDDEEDEDDMRAPDGTELSASVSPSDRTKKGSFILKGLKPAQRSSGDETEALKPKSPRQFFGRSSEDDRALSPRRTGGHT